MLEGTVRVELVDRDRAPHVTRSATIRVILDVGEGKPFMAALETAHKTLEVTKQYGLG